MGRATYLAWSLLVLASCATTPRPGDDSEPEPPVSLDSVNQRPRLLGCTAYPEPGLPDRNVLRTYSVAVVLDLVVRSDGSVSGGSLAAPAVGGTRDVNPNPSDVARALAVAKTCRYAPARAQNAGR